MQGLGKSWDKEWGWAGHYLERDDEMKRCSVDDVFYFNCIGIGI